LRRKSMRYVVVAGAVILIAAVAGVQYAGAVGYDVLGKEKCSCDPLVARGVLPDTANKLWEVLFIPKLGFILDRIAVEGKAMLAQFGAAEQPEVQATTSAPSGTETVAAPKERVHRPAKKRAKKRRLKIPPRRL
jgi:hypothetical protein